MTRQKAPLFGRTRMIGDAQSSSINIAGTGLSVEVIGSNWTIRARRSDDVLSRGEASGPQAAANAARDKLIGIGEKVRAM